jgi:anthranilate/para-aminobenzoate synthase component I
MVQAAKEYIKCGDIYQANLSQRLSIPIQGDAWQLYRRLRNINPSPFASYLELEDVTIASSSPERLLAVRSDIVETRPIAGTRRRGNNISEDRKLSRDLILSPKERAEHIMLVDLERNDLGRFCRYGTVAVNELMTLENYSHVIHIVSNVRGRLKAGKDKFDAIASCFPGGTITGTPKIRSMEIIDELEKVARSIYTGSIGYFNYGGEMDLNIVIRTFVITGKYAYVQVGAGIVADSDPEREYYETLHKAEALIKAVRSGGIV